MGRSQDVDLQVRLGLNSGEVVVGRVADDVTLDPTALGHTVGLAQRMEAMVEPGRPYLTEHTARLVESWFRLTDLGPTVVKGAREALGVFVLDGPRNDRTEDTSRLVGRAKELALLEDALTSATGGRAQVVGVVGEAGVGKSRLCEEFARMCAARGITVRRATGVSHGKEVPLLPVLALLRNYFAVSVTDTPQEARERLSRRLLDLDPDLAGDLSLLFDFLEVPDPAQPAPHFSAEVRMRRVFDLLRRLTARRSERETLVLLVEDLHWFDPQSETFLERLIESFPGTRTLVVTNFRPEFSAPWMRHSYYRQVSLAPLEDDAVGELIGGLLGLDRALAPLLGFVAERTGGNPFFVEEVVRALIEDGALAGGPGAWHLTRPLNQVSVPPSVQAVLAARIDRLPAEQKEVLQTAAVIGRTFAGQVLAEVLGRTSDELEIELAALCAAELLQQRSLHPVVEYRFWHPLTQEVAYGTLLSGRRAHLHAAVAQAMEEPEQERRGEQAGVIAWHWERAARPVEAARWSAEAGTWALRSDLDEAQRRWLSVVHLLAGVPESDESLELGIRARARLFQFGARTGMAPDEAERLYVEARALADRLGDPKVLAWVVAVSGSSKVWAGRLRDGLDRYLEGADLAERTGDVDLQAAVWVAPPIPLRYLGPVGEGLAWAERHLAVCAGDPDRGVGYLGYSPLTRALNNRARILVVMGRLSDAARDVEEALALARTRAEPEPLAWALAVAGELAWAAGEDDRFGTAAQEAVKIGEETGNTAGLVLGLQSLALSELAAQRPSSAVATCGRALREMRERRSGLFAEASVLAHLSRAKLAAGDATGAATAAENAVAVARAQGAKVAECLALLTRAQTGRASGADPVAVLADLDAAQTLVKEFGPLTYEPFLQEERGRLRGDEGELREALRLFNAIGATGHARRLHAELASSI